MQFTPVTAHDAAALAAVRVAAAERLTRDFGEGHWSAHTNEAAVLRDIKASRVLAVRERGEIVGTLTLQTKKPWSIDLSYFTPCAKALYLINMAVTPERQRSGLGRALLVEALARRARVSRRCHSPRCLRQHRRGRRLLSQVRIHQRRRQVVSRRAVVVL